MPIRTFNVGGTTYQASGSVVHNRMKDWPSRSYQRRLNNLMKRRGDEALQSCELRPPLVPGPLTDPCK